MDILGGLPPYIGVSVNSTLVNSAKKVLTSGKKYAILTAMENYYTVGEVARQFERHPMTVRNWCRNGTIEATKTGGGTMWLIPGWAIVDFKPPRRGRPPKNNDGDGKA